MAKKTVPNPNPARAPEVETIPAIPSPAPESRPAATAANNILVSIGGYNLAAIATVDGFNLSTADLPADFSITTAGSTGHMLQGEKQAFAVIGVEPGGPVLRVKIALG